METTIIIHTENEDKLRQLFKLINQKIDKTKFTIFIHAKGYIPWSVPDLLSEIKSFSRYLAFPNNSSISTSIVELLLKTTTDNVLILDENIESLDDGFYFNRTELLKLNLDTKYKTLKWFNIDILSQKDKKISKITDESDDCKRYVEKSKSPLFFERVIYVDGGLGDHVMALPLLERLAKDVYVSCKSPFIYQHLPVKGFIPWTDDLFGGYSRFVYQYGSANNSKTIIDAFFELYGLERNDSDILKYNGKIDQNPEIVTNKKIALICTSAAKIKNLDSNKDWNDIRWLKLTEKLKKKDYFVIQVGSKKDNQIPTVDLKFLDKPISNLAGLINDSSLWISVDTFFHHFASAVKPDVGICLTPYYNDHAKHKGVTYIEKDCGKNYFDRRWWLDLQQPERKECMDLIQVEDVLKKIDFEKTITLYSAGSIDDNCSNWRIYQQYDGLKDFKFIFKNSFGSNIAEDLSSDVIIICRPIINCIDYIRYLKKNNKKVILDFDDAFPYTSLNNIELFSRSISEVIQSLDECDLITTTSEYLKYYFSLFTKTKCVVLPNIINPKYINQNKVDNGDKIVLGWFGSRGHIDSVRPISNVLLKILNEFDNVYLNLYTDNPQIFEMLKHKKTTYTAYNRDFLTFQNKVGEIDINLAPLEENYINLHKSNIRIILPGYKGIPSVASKFAEYKNIGEENILLCESENDWYENLKKLITDKNLYKKYSDNIKSKINSDFSFESWAENKKKILNNLING